MENDRHLKEKKTHACLKVMIKKKQKTQVDVSAGKSLSASE